ncbi:hypothetical protein TorRG33x02_324770, partial [Trema orientale]
LYLCFDFSLKASLSFIKMLVRGQFWLVGFLHKVMFLVLFLSLLVFGEKELADEESSSTTSLVVVVDKLKEYSPGLYGKQLKRSLRHSFDALFSSKRKVPNASDPLHNR